MTSIVAAAPITVKEAKDLGADGGAFDDGANDSWKMVHLLKR